MTTTVRKGCLVTEFETKNLLNYMYTRDFIVGQLTGQGQKSIEIRKESNPFIHITGNTCFVSQASLWYVGPHSQPGAVRGLSRPADAAGHQRFHVTHAASRQFYSEFNANCRNQIWWSKYLNLTSLASYEFMKLH